VRIHSAQLPWALPRRVGLTRESADNAQPTHSALTGACLPAANVRWEGAQCLSVTTGDRYFSPDGPAEVQRVFMAPADLEARFRRTTETFTCGETGFGTGLNTAVLAEAFCAHAPPSARLHLISLERTPLSAFDMQKMAGLWQTTLPVYRELASQYPPLLTGWHRLHLCGGRVCLSLYFGAALDGLADIAGRQRLPVDHWLLDGFAPPKNPSLWRPELFAQLARFAVSGSTVATYTAVGEVRRNLVAAGFSMRKVDQMPLKLHSLVGTMEGALAAPAKPYQRPEHIQILGGGIAAASVARSLADRGMAATLVVPLGKLAQYASRIPAAALHARLRDDGSTGAAWQAMSYHYAHRRLVEFAGYEPSGVVQISGPNTSPERLAALLTRYGGSGSWLCEGNNKPLEFAIGGTVRGPTLVQALRDHSLIQQTSTPRSIAADHLPGARNDMLISVLASGIASRDHPAAGYLELASLPGQAELCAHATPPEQPIVGAGYMAPCRGGMVIGSTYEYRTWEPADATRANLAPWLDTGRHRASFRGSRTITSDRAAIVGRLYDRSGAAIPGVRISTGFGSTGMTSAPLAGECIAAELAGEFAPVTRELLDAVSSLRFRKRQARRGLRMGAVE